MKHSKINVNENIDTSTTATSNIKTKNLPKLNETIAEKE